MIILIRNAHLPPNVHGRGWGVNFSPVEFDATSEKTPLNLAALSRLFRVAAQRAASATEIVSVGADVSIVGIFPRRTIETGGDVTVTFSRPVVCHQCTGAGCGTCLQTGRVAVTQSARVRLPERCFGEVLRLKDVGGEGLPGFRNGSLNVKITAEDSVKRRR